MFIKYNGRPEDHPCRHCKERPRYRWAQCRQCYYARLRERNAKKKKPKTCIQCSKEFMPKRSFASYCSARCREDRRIATYKPRPAKCRLCGTDYTQTGIWDFFCSRRCKNKDGWSYKKKNPPGWKPEAMKIKATCRECGVVFEAMARSYGLMKKKSREPKFCSTQCMYKGRLGPKHASYRGGSLRSRGTGWGDLSAKIRKRDGMTCRRCGSDEKRLVVDHIVPYRLMLKWGLEANHEHNLLTLCRSCHGFKVPAENALFKGDVVGFAAEMKRMGYPIGPAIIAFQLAGFSMRLLEQ